LCHVRCAIQYLKSISLTVDISVWGKELIVRKSYKLSMISLEFLPSVEAVEFPTADTHLNLRLTVENLK